ncbi:MAG: CBS domain-containing protein [Rhodospirillaceae bacterium]|nr:CBS domain-containing protein [Rhodospirillaceae bacterium]
MLARDIMTPTVATLSPDDTVVSAARLFVQQRIGGAPVVDGGLNVVGIVSEGDLMRRAELGTEREWSGWREFLTGKRTLATAFIRSHAVKIGDIMTAPVWTMGENAPLAEIAEMFERKHIRRVPVVRDRRLVGIVSRADMVRALIERWAEAHPDRAIDDEAIRRSIIDNAAAERWIDSGQVNVKVLDGIVDLYGTTDSEDTARALQVLAEAMPGVRKVDNHLRLRTAPRMQHAV